MIFIMAAVAIAVAAISIWLLYDAAFEQGKARLAEAAQNQARLIESVARFDAKYRREAHPEGAAAATLEQIAEAHENQKGLGITGEYTLARRQGDKIVFLLRYRHFDLDNPKQVPWRGERAEPMRRALQGLSGTVVGLDYRGVTVLAAHEPVAVLNLGIVVKIDLVEIRAPFIRAAMVSVAGGILVVFIGALLFRRAVVPLLERERILAALHESEKKFRNLVEGSRQGVMIVSRDSNILFCNQAGAEMYGYANPREVTALANSFDLVAPHERGRFAEYGKARLRGEDAASVFEFEGLRKDGSSVHIQSTQTFLDWEGQAAIQYAIIDITERKRAEAASLDAKEEAERANLAKTNFLAHFSHELRTPLNAILGFSEIMQGELFGPLGDRRYGEYAGDIHQSGEHLLALISDILDLSRIEAGQLEKDEQVFDAGEVAEECARLLRGRAGEKGVTIDLRLPEAGLRLRADERQLRQILLNLLSNAVKFTRPNTHVTLAAEIGDNGEMRFRVNDGGEGVAPGDIARMQEPFVRLEGPLTNSAEGTGLGLAITKRLVESHGGNLRLSSEIGVGTTATVNFPADRVIGTGCPDQFQRNF